MISQMVYTIFFSPFKFKTEKIKGFQKNVKRQFALRISLYISDHFVKGNGFHLLSQSQKNGVNSNKKQM